MLLTLRDLQHSELLKFLTKLNPLCSPHLTVFEPYLSDLLTLLPGLILPPLDATRTFPKGGHFKFPPDVSHDGWHVDEDPKEKRDKMCQAALEVHVNAHGRKKRVCLWYRGLLDGRAERCEVTWKAWQSYGTTIATLGLMQM